jgi:hypothetical protein
MAGDDPKREKMMQELANLMRTFFENALETARFDFERHDLDVRYSRSATGDELTLERTGVILSVVLDRSRPSIIVTVGDERMVELVYDLERGEIVTGTRNRPPNLQRIFSSAMTRLIDQALAKPS